MTKRLTAIDREALERAIAIDRQRDRATRQQIDDKLEREPWREVAEFAAYGCQCTALHLKPWQPPPCWAEIDDQDNQAGPISGHRAAAELLRRLLAAGLSRYEPDPINALEPIARARSRTCPNSAMACCIARSYACSGCTSTRPISKGRMPRVRASGSGETVRYRGHLS